ncbi:MAG: hypothetical protein O7C61_12770 [SAR324 cluster bacterium]|nr:hypothetical protein [SAR324 cluster bacterium]
MIHRKAIHKRLFPLVFALLAVLLLAGCGDDISSAVPVGGGGSESFTYNLDGAGDVTITQALPESCLAGVYVTDALPAPGTAILGLWNLSTTFDLFEIDFSGSTTGTGLTPDAVLWWADGVVLAGYTSGTLNVTSYGGVGGSIVGDFNFVITDLTPTAYTLTGSFNVTRLSDTVSASAACA